MKKIYVLLLTGVLFLSSCSWAGLHTKFFLENDGPAAKKTFEQVLEAIQAQDTEALRKMFSKAALSEAENMDERVTSLIEFFQGKVLSIDDWGGPSASESILYGEKTKELRSTFDVETSERKYRFALKEVTVDTANKDNVGIHSIYIKQVKDGENLMSAYWGDGKWTPGINIEPKDDISNQ